MQGAVKIIKHIEFVIKLLSSVVTIIRNSATKKQKQ